MSKQKILLCTVIAMALSVTTFISSPVSASGNKEEKIPVQITEQYIEEHGIHTYDENGNKIIEVPLGPSSDTGKLIPEFTKTHDKNEIHHDNLFTDNDPDVVSPQHFNLLAHTHKIKNLSSRSYSNFVPVTQYANAGFTVSKSYNRTFTLNTSINLLGGIDKGAVTRELGIEVGGSWSWGSGEEYSAVVPDGYRGRISYRYSSTLYTFDNETTYVLSSLPYRTLVETDRCTAESKPHSGYYYLQLISNK